MNYTTRTRADENERSRHAFFADLREKHAVFLVDSEAPPNHARRRHGLESDTKNAEPP